MRIASVTAGAFGPLEGQKLELAPGLTVIVGRNESAKSSWHAAIYAGLCGRRRGKGAATLADRRFSDLHRPWDGAEWSVEVEVVLDDGRRIQIRQDLANKVDSRAMDLALGRDVSDEIINDGAPDGAVWLGLDRESFLATACINQAALMEVLESASALQDYLGRAAASATADVTAAHALELIDDFQKEHVGRLAVNAIRPLKRATDALQAAKVARDAAGLAHEAYIELVVAAEAARTTADEAALHVQEAEQQERAVERYVEASREARQAEEKAAQARQRRDASASALAVKSELVEQVVQLDTEFGGQPPVGLAEAEDIAGHVNDALALWAAAPAPILLDGDSAQSLRDELAQLPEGPAGDTQPDEAVRRAHADLIAARTRLTAHEERRPEAMGEVPDPQLAAAIAATPAVVRGLAADMAAADALATESPGQVEELGKSAIVARERANTLRQAAEEAANRGAVTTIGASRMPSTIAWIAAAVLAVATVVAFVIGQPAIGAAAAVLAGVAFVVGLVTVRRRPGSGKPAPAESSATADWTTASNAEREAVKAEELHKTAVANAAKHEAVRADVEARCAARGLPAEAGQLRQLAESVDVWRAEQADHERWSADHDDATRSVVTLEERTRRALEERDPSCVDAQRSVDELVGQYESACAQRSSQAAQAARRTGLQERIGQREKAEADYARSLQLRRDAVAAVRAAAVAADVTGAHEDGDDDETRAEVLVAELESWQRRRLEQAGLLDQARARWQRLQVLLNGATLEQLREDLAESGDAHKALSDQVSELEAIAVAAEDRRCAAGAAAGLEAGVTPDVPSAEFALEATRRLLADARRAAQDASTAAERAETVRSERAAGLMSVAEAEEALAVAQAEVARVQELASTLSLTTEFLQRAQERVHRDIAPVLTATLTEWLPRVTDGRYSEAMIDPATLRIQVRAAGKPWRHADRLTIGTAEQIFLLLRMSLAQHLAVTGETCPLLLDDVTVQADPVRTVQILELLRSVAEHRQVILFAQEPSVEEWARTKLAGDQHAVITLEQVATV